MAISGQAAWNTVTYQLRRAPPLILQQTGLETQRLATPQPRRQIRGVVLTDAVAEDAIAVASVAVPLARRIGVCLRRIRAVAECESLSLTLGARLRRAYFVHDNHVHEDKRFLVILVLSEICFASYRFLSKLQIVPPVDLFTCFDSKCG